MRLRPSTVFGSRYVAEISKQSATVRALCVTLVVCSPLGAL